MLPGGEEGGVHFPEKIYFCSPPTDCISTAVAQTAVLKTRMFVCTFVCQVTPIINIKKFSPFILFPYIPCKGSSDSSVLVEVYQHWL